MLVSKTSTGCVIDTRHRGIEKAVGKDVKKADMLSVPIFASTFGWVQLTLAPEKKTLDSDTEKPRFWSELDPEQMTSPPRPVFPPPPHTSLCAYSIITILIFR